MPTQPYRSTEGAVYTASEVRRHTLSDGRHYVRGYVRTWAGTVEVYAQGSDRDRGYSYVQFTRDGRTYRREYDTRYSPRYLATLAKRLSEDVRRGRFEPS